MPSGKHTKNYGTSPFLMGQLTISMAIFNSYVSLPEGIYIYIYIHIIIYMYTYMAWDWLIWIWIHIKLLPLQCWKSKGTSIGKGNRSCFHLKAISMMDDSFPVAAPSKLIPLVGSSECFWCRNHFGVKHLIHVKKAMPMLLEEPPGNRKTTFPNLSNFPGETLGGRDKCKTMSMCVYI